MKFVDFPTIVKEAWANYQDERSIKFIYDMSVRVSTNHVYKIDFHDGSSVFAKLSYFGAFEYFKEDHTIINMLANTLPPPYEHFLAKSLTQEEEVFVYRFKNEIIDAWVVFYQPIPIANKLPRRLESHHILKMGEELARFHLACAEVSYHLPPSSKTLQTDIDHLLRIMDTPHGQFEHRGHTDEITYQCERFFQEMEALGYEQFLKLPVFTDWNIGNFSVSRDGSFFSRWDYDWFRMGSRVLDFYFFSRVVSDVGDRTIFSYVFSTLMEERFLLFLQAYHKVYPLTEKEIRFIKEAYRFFILNYVIKDGKYFFHEIYATRLQMEAFSNYFPNLDRSFSVTPILKALGI